MACAEMCIRKTPSVDAWRAKDVSNQDGKGKQAPCAMLGRGVEVEVGWFRRANQRNALPAVPCSRSRHCFPCDTHLQDRPRNFHDNTMD